MIEPIKRCDMPGYYLKTQDRVHDVVQMAAAPNLKVQMDLYLCQITEGEVSTKLRQ